MATVTHRLDIAPPTRHVPIPMEKKPLTRGFHRIAEARKQQGISLRSIAKNYRCQIRELRKQECPQSDLRLSDLYRWQAILKVPIAELLDEPDMTSLSPPIMKRAQLLRMMKTARSIIELAVDESVGRMGERLAAQLTEMMPELAEVRAWPSDGQRRTQDEFGRAANAVVCREVFARDLLE